MTAQTSAVGAGQKTPIPGTAGKGRAWGASAAWSVIVSAVLSWGAGDVARSTWHLSLPFLAGWLIVLLIVLLISHLAGVVAWAWHKEKANATAEIAAKAKVAEGLAEQWLASAAARALAAKLSGPGGA